MLYYRVLLIRLKVISNLVGVVMNYLGYRVFDDNGYPSIYLPSSCYARQNGAVRVHLLQAEILLGRPLNTFEVVHHKDEDKYNWDLSNLMVFKSIADHSAYHKGCKILLDITTGTYYCPNKNTPFNICKDCGARIDKKSVRCCKCNQIFLSGREYPTRDELKCLIRELSFTEIGRLYNVSDNAVRKWCDNLGLPRSKREIKCLSNEDWINL